MILVHKSNHFETKTRQPRQNNSTPLPNPTHSIRKDINVYFFFELNAFSSSIWYTSKIGQEQPSKLTSNKEMQRAGGNGG